MIWPLRSPTCTIRLWRRSIDDAGATGGGRPVPDTAAPSGWDDEMWIVDGAVIGGGPRRIWTADGGNSRGGVSRRTTTYSPGRYPRYVNGRVVQGATGHRSAAFPVRA